MGKKRELITIDRDDLFWDIPLNENLNRLVSMIDDIEVGDNPNIEAIENQISDILGMINLIEKNVATMEELDEEQESRIGTNEDKIGVLSLAITELKEEIEDMHGDIDLEALSEDVAKLKVSNKDLISQILELKENKASKEDIPTKLSELENDIDTGKNYDEDIIEINKNIEALDTKKADKEEVPTKLSQLEKDIDMGKNYDEEIGALEVVVKELNKIKANREEIPTKLSELEQDIEVEGKNYDEEIKLLNETTEKLESTKADKTNIPTKLSELEQDIELGKDYDDVIAEIENEIKTLATEAELQLAVERLEKTIKDMTEHIPSMYEELEVLSIQVTAIKASLDNKLNIDKYNEDMISVNQHISSESNPHRVTKKDIGLENVEDKSAKDIIDEIQAEDIKSALGYTPEDIKNKGVADGYAPLNANGKIPVSLLPDSSKQQTYVLDSESEMSELSDLLNGDRCYILDTGDSYIWDGVGWKVQSKAEWENVNLDWGNIVNKPNSTTQMIDDTVLESHKHSNKDILDKITRGKVDEWNTVSNKASNEDMFAIDASLRESISEVNIKADDIDDDLRYRMLELGYMFENTQENVSKIEKNKADKKIGGKYEWLYDDVTGGLKLVMHND